MPNCFAAERTVAPVSIMYTANAQARCSKFVVIGSPPMLCCWKILCVTAGRYAALTVWKERDKIGEYLKKQEKTL